MSLAICLVDSTDEAVTNSLVGQSSVLPGTAEVFVAASTGPQVTLPDPVESSVGCTSMEARASMKAAGWT